MITALRLQHFRSYQDATFALSPNVTIIVGPNASGKTNLLEAVLVAARGSSYRVSDAELVQHGASWARVDAHTPDGDRIIKIQQQAAETWRKSFEIDGQKLSRLLPARMLPVVLFEPNHLLLLTGSPELRRSFLDDLLEQMHPSFGATRRHYKRVLAQRNSLLKKQPPGVREQLFVWNLRLSELGGKIARSRQTLVDQFDRQLSAVYSRLAGLEQTVTLQYVANFPAATYETALLQTLEASTELDLLRGFTAAGPHRDDLQVLLRDYPASETASRGETRSLVLALKLLELEILENIHHQPPLLLLDDVFSELDQSRRQALTRAITGQALITTTDADSVVEHFANGSIVALGS